MSKPFTVYMVALVYSDKMIMYDDKIYKNKTIALKKCIELNEDGSHFVVVCADNWHVLEVE